MARILNNGENLLFFATFFCGMDFLDPRRANCENKEQEQLTKLVISRHPSYSHGFEKVPNFCYVVKLYKITRYVATQPQQIFS